MMGIKSVFADSQLPQLAASLRHLPKVVLTDSNYKISTLIPL